MNQFTMPRRGALVTSLVIALLVPAAALAGPGRSGATAGKPTLPTPAQAAASGRTPSAARGSKPTTGTGQPIENLNKRIANVVAARGRRFDAASNAISGHIRRVAAIADKVAAAGGDVSAARAYLSEATSALNSADTLEQAAVAQLASVPSATDRKAAFRDARASGKTAVAELKVARTKTVLAVQAVRAAVKGAGTTDESSETP